MSAEKSGLDPDAPSVLNYETTFTAAPVAGRRLENLIHEYWARKGFRLQRDGQGSIVGARGSYWQNTVTFDIRRVRSEIRIEVRPQGEVSCQLLVSAWMQVISSAEKRRLADEVAAFREAFVTGKVDLACSPASQVSPDLYLWPGLLGAIAFLVALLFS